MGFHAISPNRPGTIDIADEASENRTGCFSSGNDETGETGGAPVGEKALDGVRPERFSASRERLANFGIGSTT